MRSSFFSFRRDIPRCALFSYSGFQLLYNAPKLTVRYMHDFCKAAQNIHIPTTPYVVSTLHITYLSPTFFHSIVYILI